MWQLEPETFSEVDTDEGRVRIYAAGDRILRVTMLTEVAPDVLSESELEFNELTQLVRLPSGRKAKLERIWGVPGG